MIEFKQIIGRGTRLFDGKAWFTIYDFVNACRLFEDKEWDGEPIEPGPKLERAARPPAEPLEHEPATTPQMLRIQLADGKVREIEHSSATLLLDRDGCIIPAAECLRRLFGELPQLFQNEDELRRIWSQPMTRKELLNRLNERTGCGPEQLAALLELKYRAVADAVERLGSISSIRCSFIDFQGYLYEKAA